MASAPQARATSTLEFFVRDDGRGVDPGAAGRGTGLLDIEDRLDAIGGSLRIETAPHEGVTLSGSVPVRGPS
jgi:signal transduction histidine kinase